MTQPIADEIPSAYFGNIFEEQEALLKQMWAAFFNALDGKSDTAFGYHHHCRSQVQERLDHQSFADDVDGTILWSGLADHAPARRAVDVCRGG